MKIFSCIALLAFAACAGGNADLGSSSSATQEQELIGRRSTRVLIMRHAEKADASQWNTDLSSEGFDRANAWVEILSAYWPDALYTSNLQRTQHTLQPTADYVGLTPQIRPLVDASPDRPTVDDTTALATEILNDHRGQTTIVTWHTPYVRDLAIALGVPEADAPEWDHATYNHLWVVNVYRDGTARLSDRIY